MNNGDDGGAKRELKIGEPSVKTGVQTEDYYWIDHNNNPHFFLYFSKHKIDIYDCACWSVSVCRDAVNITLFRVVLMCVIGLLTRSCSRWWLTSLKTIWELGLPEPKPSPATPLPTWFLVFATPFVSFGLISSVLIFQIFTLRTALLHSLAVLVYFSAVVLWLPRGLWRSFPAPSIITTRDWWPIIRKWWPHTTTRIHTTCETEPDNTISWATNSAWRKSTRTW